MTIVLNMTGLFHAVIEQSGCDTTFWAVNRPEQMPWNYPKLVAENVNCTTETTAEMVDCLRSVDAGELRRNQEFTCTVNTKRLRRQSF